MLPIYQKNMTIEWRSRMQILKYQWEVFVALLVQMVRARHRQTLLESDPKAAQAYNDVVRRPEYRALLDRRHQIEAAWTAAPENEREGMLNEMNSLRQQGFTLILGEIQRLQS